MGTRGVIGFRIDGQDKISYLSSDSYPSGAGREVIQDTKVIISDLETYKQKVRDLKVVSEEVFEHYDPLSILEDGTIQDASDFVTDSLFCEYGYIINLDDENIEFYRGFVKEPGMGRYALLPRYERPSDGMIDETYYPITLVAQIPFTETASKTTDELVELMENSYAD